MDGWEGADGGGASTIGAATGAAIIVSVIEAVVLVIMRAVSFGFTTNCEVASSSALLRLPESPQCTS